MMSVIDLLLNIPGLGVGTPATAPAISVVANGVNTANGGTRNAGSSVQGGTLTFDVIVTNSGDAALVLGQPTASDSDVSVDTFTPGLTVTAGNSAQFTITCDTTTIGTGITSDVSFTNNVTGESPFVIHVTFSVTAVPAPEIRMSIDGDVIADGGTYDAGNVTQGTDGTLTVTIANLGDAVLTVTSPPTTGGNVSAGAISDTTIDPSGSATFTLTLDADLSGGSKSGTISIANDDSDENPYNFTVNFTVLAPEMRVLGNGVEIADGDASASSGDHTQFAATTVGSTVTRTYTIENTGTANLTIGTITVPSGFTVTASPTSPVAPSGSTTFTVRCDAGSAATFSGDISIVNNDLSENPYNFAISCVVAALAEMQITGNGNEITDGDTTPSATDHTQFAATTIGTTTSRTYTINNTGGADLTGVTVTPPSGFTLTTAPSSTIAAGGNSTFTIRCNAGSVATLTGTVSVASNDADENPYTFDISCVVANTYSNFVTNTIAPNRWYRMQQLPGATNEPNAANPGTNDATISGATLNQSGQLGAGEAYSFDAVDDYVQAPAASDINGILPATWIIVTKVNSRGEGNNEALFDKSNDIRLNISGADATSPYTVAANVNFSGGTLTGTWSDVLPVSTWTMLALRLNSDNTLDLIVNGTKQTTSAAGSGTKSSTTNPVYIGNRAAQDRTLDGLIDEFIFENSAVSDANLLTMAQLAGLA